jgi:hypothetical protein
LVAEYRENRIGKMVVMAKRRCVMFRRRKEELDGTIDSSGWSRIGSNEMSFENRKVGE